MKEAAGLYEIVSSFELLIPLATLVSPAHRDGFEAVVRAARALVVVCATRRPSSEELAEVWRTLRDLPAGREWRSDVETASSMLGVEVPSWTPPEEAFDMLAALTEAVKHIVMAMCRPAHGGGFVPRGAQREAEHIAEAVRQIEKAAAKAEVLGLVI
jgi:hypothetical protein